MHFIRMGSRGTTLGLQAGRVERPDKMTMTPIAAATAGALISGVAMYTIGAKTATVDAFTQAPALVQTADGQYVPATRLATVPAAQLVSQPQVVSRPAATPRRTVYRPAASQSR